MDAIDGVLNATALRLPGHHGIEDMRLRQWSRVVGDTARG